MSQGEHEKKVQERAYAIWESEGRPDGRHEQHWQDAVREVASAASLAVTSVGKAVRRTAKKVVASLTPGSDVSDPPKTPAKASPKRIVKPRAAKKTPAVTARVPEQAKASPSVAATRAKPRPRTAKTKKP
jgi:hypothetical protein